MIYKKGRYQSYENISPYGLLGLQKMAALLHKPSILYLECRELTEDTVEHTVHLMLRRAN
jgi:hypothetical protein